MIILRLISVPDLDELMGLMIIHSDLTKRIAMQRKSWPDSGIVPDEMIKLK